MFFRAYHEKYIVQFFFIDLPLVLKHLKISCKEYVWYLVDGKMHLPYSVLHKIQTIYGVRKNVTVSLLYMLSMYMYSWSWWNITVPRWRALCSWSQICCTCSSVTALSLNHSTKKGLNLSLSVKQFCSSSSSLSSSCSLSSSSSFSSLSSSSCLALFLDL